MAVQTVFNGNLDPSSGNLSARFVGATGFFIQAPDIASELEIDCFLQVYLPSSLGEIARNIPLGKIEETAVILNITDTETFNVIPSELQNTELEMALLFLPSDSTFLTAEVIKPNISLTTVAEKLDAIAASNSDVVGTVANLDLQLSQADAGIFSLAQGLSFMLSNQQGRRLRNRTARRLNKNRRFL